VPDDADAVGHHSTIARHTGLAHGVVQKRIDPIVTPVDAVEARLQISSIRPYPDDGSSRADALGILHVPDYFILLYGRAVKSDLQKIALSAVSADGLNFYVPVIFINKAKRKPLCLGDFQEHIEELPAELRNADDPAITCAQRSNPTIQT
jgi:hypothetical protein